VEGGVVGFLSLEMSAVQLAALRRAGGDGCAEIAAGNLDAMPSAENARLWQEALVALGWPEPSA
jgi:hypothetical protein